MTNEADSLLTAVKKTAQALDIKWPELQKVYHALQSQDPYTKIAWLPKSQGRQVWSAEPNFISRLIAAYAFSDNEISLSDAVFLTYGLAAGDEDQYATRCPFESRFSHYLGDTNMASKLKHVKFSLRKKQIVFEEWDQSITLNVSDDSIYELRDDLFALGVIAAKSKTYDQKKWNDIYISGSTIFDIANSVKWRLGGQAPYSNQPEYPDEVEGANE